MFPVTINQVISTGSALLNTDKEVKNGVKIEDLEKQYIQERMPKNTPDNVSNMDENKEKQMAQQLNITDDELAKCRDNGIRGLDIGIVKALSLKYKVTFDKVVETKKDSKDWKEVNEKLGGSK